MSDGREGREKGRGYTLDHSVTYLFVTPTSSLSPTTQTLSVPPEGPPPLGSDPKFPTYPNLRVSPFLFEILSLKFLPTPLGPNSDTVSHLRSPHVHLDPPLTDSLQTFRFRVYKRNYVLGHQGPTLATSIYFVSDTKTLVSPEQGDTTVD